MLATNICPVSTRTARTRTHLQEVALDLFARQGFEETTVAQVAAAAGVSQMTFFRHFPTKESVVADDPYDPLIARAVTTGPADLPPVERVRQAVLAAWQQVPEPAEDAVRRRLVLATVTPSLRARVWLNNEQTERLVAAALVDTGVPRLEARVAAGAVFGALTAALLDWAEPTTVPATHEPLGARIAAALAILAPVGGR